MINKSQIVLYIYDDLISHKEIYINDIVNKYGISTRTFRRYIAEINAFLFNNYRNQSIQYDLKEKVYRLKVLV